MPEAGERCVQPARKIDDFHAVLPFPSLKFVTPTALFSARLSIPFVILPQRMVTTTHDGQLQVTDPLSPGSPAPAGQNVTTHQIVPVSIVPVDPAHQKTRHQYQG